MSAGTGESPLRQERDLIPARVVYTGAAALALLVAAGLFITWIVVPRLPVHVGPTDPGPAAVKGVRESLFTQSGSDTRAAKRRALERYQWADRDRQTVDLPIERAMDLVVRGIDVDR